MVDTLSMLRELAVSEQRYQAVLAVIAEGCSVVEVAGRFGVSRQSVHAWLAKYEAEGVAGLEDHSHRPRSSLARIPADVEALGCGHFVLVRSQVDLDDELKTWLTEADDTVGLQRNGPVSPG